MIKEYHPALGEPRRSATQVKLVTAAPVIRAGAGRKVIRAGAGGRKGKEKGGGGKREGGVAEARAPRRPHNDWTVRAPDVHPAKREESTSGSDVLPEAGPRML